MKIKAIIKRQMILSIVTIILTVITITGASYALFYIVVSNQDNQVVKTGNLVITFLGSSAINIESIDPISDSDALARSDNIYTFTIENSGTVPYAYQIYLQNDSSYLIGGANYNENRNLLSHQYLRYNFNNTTNETLGDQTEGEIFSGMLKAGQSVEYNVRLWVADAEEYNLPNDVLESEVHLNIVVKGKAGGVVPNAPDGWFIAKEGTLLKAVKDSYSVTEPATTPGRQISASEEALLASAPDDYGTSYYFRGAVDKNFVEFAGMCWRIVRVTGDSSIKLVLYNNNESGSANPCSVSSSTGAFARHTGTTYTSAFNSTYDQNAYIGFKYGTPGSSTYEAEHANINKSTILTNLETWYNLRMKDYTRYLADTIWCNDKSVDTAYVYGTTLGYAVNKTGYSARGRIYAGGSTPTAANPSLECPNAGSDNKLSKFSVSDRINGNGNLTYKVGLLTADEVAFAGARYYNPDGSSDNSTYYLNQNASGASWWSLTPYYFDSANAAVCVVDSTGYLGYNYVSYGLGLRPAVSLVSTTKITSGNGTSSTPYIIQTT